MDEEFSRGGAERKKIVWNSGIPEFIEMMEELPRDHGLGSIGIIQKTDSYQTAKLTKADSVKRRFCRARSKPASPASAAIHDSGMGRGERRHGWRISEPLFLRGNPRSLDRLADFRLKYLPI
jgi:hypothetical protein